MRLRLTFQFTECRSLRRAAGGLEVEEVFCTVYRFSKDLENSFVIDKSLIEVNTESLIGITVSSLNTEQSASNGCYFLGILGENDSTGIKVEFQPCDIKPSKSTDECILLGIISTDENGPVFTKTSLGIDTEDLSQIVKSILQDNQYETILIFPVESSSEKNSSRSSSNLSSLAAAGLVQRNSILLNDWKRTTMSEKETLQSQLAARDKRISQLEEEMDNLISSLSKVNIERDLLKTDFELLLQRSLDDKLRLTDEQRTTERIKSPRRFWIKKTKTYL